MTEAENRELLVRLATNVTGWNVTFRNSGGRERWMVDVDDEGYPHRLCIAGDSPIRHWSPTENLTDAWMLVNALNKRMFVVNTSQALESLDAGFNAPLWHVCTITGYTLHKGRPIGNGGLFQKDAATLPMAICLAADEATRGEA